MPLTVLADWSPTTRSYERSRAFFNRYSPESYDLHNGSVEQRHDMPYPSEMKGLNLILLTVALVTGCRDTPHGKSMGGYIVIALENDIGSLPVAGTVSDDEGSFDYTISEAKGIKRPEGITKVIQVGFDITVETDDSTQEIVADIDRRIRRELSLVGDTLDRAPQ